ncbi:hypothetical protein [Streptomyces profundus]|uniref:hypothetical protein n=1 Tax=Streptomyces profundus TaxID=2867410 RepID=UPI001D166579|nr:hypothetical protein [Streptomyces sp. MA3_2.13]UED86223.1 hypothetical protein K4G22_20175 [Streptomyces sp. MA3_2.13]
MSEALSGDKNTAKRRGRRKRWLLCGGTAALAAAAGAALILGSDGDGDSGCWGAWDGLRPPWSGGDVTASGSPPSREDPRGACEIVVTLTDEDDEDGDEPWQHRLEVSYGALPEGHDELATWTLEHLRGDSAPLTDGLSGSVSAEHGLLVLPERCQIDGRPAVVTMITRYSDVTLGRGDASHGSRPASSPSHMAQLLAGVARQGMAEAGCAADTADGSSVAPVGQHPSTATGELPLCGNPELPEAGQPPPDLLTSRAREVTFHEWTTSVGVGNADQTCSGSARRSGYDMLEGNENAFGPATSGTVLFSTVDPEMIRLLTAIADGLDALPVDGWAGSAVHGGPLAVTTAECAYGGGESAPTLFAAFAEAEADAPALLTDYVRAVGPHRGCEGVAPDA